MFKFKTKKLISGVLVTAMVASLLAGCGGNKTTTTDPTSTPDGTKTETTSPTASTSDGLEAADLDTIIPKETTELTVYTQLANYSGEQLGWFAKVMLDKFNVKLLIVNEGSGVFDTRVESGNLGDIVIFGSDGDQYKQAAEANLLFDWESEDLLKDYGPYINANMKTALEKNKNLNGGKIYGFGHNVATSSTEHEAFMYHPDIRWDLYKQLGYPEVKTLEDYVTVLEKMVEICPTSDSGKKTYGVSLFPDWDGDMVMFVKSTAALYGYDEFGFGLYNCNTQTYEPCLDDNSMYLRCLKFYNTLYQKGLLDPDSMTQTNEDMTEAYQDGAAFFNIFNWMGSGLYNSVEHKAAGKAMLTLASDDAQTLAYGCNVNGGNRIWTIGAKTAYPELCMAIINWLSTPEGRMIAENGPKGVTWDYGQDGKAYLTDLGLKAKADGETELTGDYSGKYNDGQNQMNNVTWSVDAENPDGKGETYNYRFWDSYLAQPVSDIEKDWQTKTGAAVADEYLEKEAKKFTLAIGSTYSPTAKTDEFKITWNQVATCIKAGSWQAIYAKTDAEFDQIVTKMKSDAKGYGYDECVTFQQNEAKLRKQAEDAVK